MKRLLASWIGFKGVSLEAQQRVPEMARIVAEWIYAGKSLRDPSRCQVDRQRESVHLDEERDDEGRMACAIWLNLQRALGTLTHEEILRFYLVAALGLQMRVTGNGSCERKADQ